MRFHINGSHLATGLQSSFELECASIEDARVQARTRGYFVLDVAPCSLGTPEEESDSDSPLPWQFDSDYWIQGGEESLPAQTGTIPSAAAGQVTKPMHTAIPQARCRKCGSAFPPGVSRDLGGPMICDRCLLEAPAQVIAEPMPLFNEPPPPARGRRIVAWAAPSLLVIALGLITMRYLPSRHGSAPEGEVDGGGAIPASAVIPASGTRSIAELSRVERHVRDGKEALRERNFRTALQAFEEARQAAPKNVAALHGAGLAALALGEENQAINYLELAARESSPPARSLALNLAGAHFKRSPMRSAKVIRDYLARDEAGDEPMLNALGTALSAVSIEERTQQLYRNMLDFYFKRESRLEAERANGLKRWGSRWVPAFVADAKSRVVKDNGEAAVRVEAELNAATAKLKVARDKERLLNTRAGRTLRPDQQKAMQDADKARQEVALLRAKLQSARNTLAGAERPPFPPEITPVPMD